MRSLLVLVVVVPLICAEGATGATVVKVKVGQTVKVPLPRQPKILGVEDPSIASLKVTPDGHALVTGLRQGRTRIVGRDFAELPIIIPLVVGPAKHHKRSE